MSVSAYFHNVRNVHNLSPLSITVHTIKYPNATRSLFRGQNKFVPAERKRDSHYRVCRNHQGRPFKC